MSRRTVGSIYKRKGSYYLEYTVNGQRTRQPLRVTTMPAAMAERDRIMAPLVARSDAARLEMAVSALGGAEYKAMALEAAKAEADRPKLPVAGAWTVFVAAMNRKKCRDITLRDYSQRWAKFTTWWAANHGTAHPAMEDVTRDHAAAFAAHLDAGSPPLSPNRWNKIIQTCRLVFNVLAHQCRSIANPFGNTAKAGICNRQMDTKGRRELTTDELRAVCRGATGELRTLLAIGLYTGLRLGDAVQLQWSAVNLDRALITVKPSKTATRANAKVLNIPLHGVLPAILEETPAAARVGYVLPALAAAHQRDNRNVSRLVGRHFEKHGIVTRTAAGTVLDRATVSFHSLRHSFVSLSASAGTPLAVVQELCGHGSPAIQRAYLHMGEGVTRAAIAALPDVLAAEPLALPPASSTAPAPEPARQVTLEAAVEALARIRAWATTARLSATARRELLAIVGA